MRKFVWLILLTLGVANIVGFLSYSAIAGENKWELHSYTTVQSDFKKYRKWLKVNDKTITGDPTGALGPAHAGKEGFREIYINETGKNVSTDKADFPYPVGTIIVKDAFMGEGGKKGPLAATTIMIKRGIGYDPAHDNWEYMMVSPAKEIRAQGKLKGCTDCHEAAEDTDYIFNDRR